MKAFGININKSSIPFLYLALTPVIFLFLRESYTLLWSSMTTRIITIGLESGFILLALPAMLKLRVWQVTSHYLWLLFAWLAWTALSSLLSGNPWGSIMRWLELSTSIIFASSIYFLIQDSDKYKNTIIISLMLTLIASLLFHLFLWNLLADPYTYNWVSDAPFFNNIRHYGYFIATILPLGYWLLETNSLNKKVISFIYLTLSWGLIFWLGGRGALLAVCLITICFCYFSRKSISWVIISIICGCFLSQLFIVESGSLNLIHFMSWFSENERGDLNSFSASRIKIYQDSLLFWWDNAPVLGLGADMFRYIMPSIPNISHPHNIFIQLIFSYGPIGLAIPLYLATSLLIKQFKLGFSRNSTLFLCVISACIHALTDGVFYHAFSIFILSIIVPLSLPPTSEKMKKTIIPKYKHYTFISISLLTIISLLYSAAFLNDIINRREGHFTGELDTIKHQLLISSNQ